MVVFPPSPSAGAFISGISRSPVMLAIILLDAWTPPLGRERERREERENQNPLNELAKLTYCLLHCAELLTSFLEALPVF